MKRALFTLVCLAGALLLAAPAAEADVFNVSTVPQFQAALTSAGGNGVDDTINVAAGTYNVTTTLAYIENPVGGTLSIVGAGPDTTFLDGGGTVQVMHLAGSGSDISLSGLTIRNGSDPSFAAGLNGTNTVGTFTISDSTFTGNTSADFAGGLQIICGLGGGIVINNSTISNNTAANYGGGAVLDGINVTVSNSTFSGNSAANEAGLQVFADTLSITNSTFSGNTIEQENGSAGLYADATVGVTMTGNTISGNTVTGPCAGNDFAVGLQITASGPVTFTRNLVDNNTTPCAAFAVGFDLNHFLDSGTVTVADNIFSRNTSGPGTLTSPINIISDDGTLNVVNNTFAGNASGQPGLSGVLLGVTNDGAVLNASNNIFSSGGFEFDNNGDGGGATSTATLRNNIFVPGDAIIGANTTQSGNLNVNPAFADGPNGDFHISDGSPAVDMGLNTAPGIQLIDFDGDLRIDGGAVDIGADEFFPPPTFDPVSDTLIIDEVQLVSNGNLRFDNAGAKAYGVVLNRLDQAGYVFELGPVKKTTASSNPGGTFNTRTGVLDIPVVAVGKGKTYNVQMQKRAGGFVFDLLKAKKN